MASNRVSYLRSITTPHQQINEFMTIGDGALTSSEGNSTNDNPKRPVYDSSQPSSQGRNKAFFLTDPNQSVRQILREMKGRERRNRQRLAEQQRIQKQEKEFKRFEHQFIIAEKRIKNRLTIEQKRFLRTRSHQEKSQPPKKNQLIMDKYNLKDQQERKEIEQKQKNASWDTEIKHPSQSQLVQLTKRKYQRQKFKSHGELSLKPIKDINKSSQKYLRKRNMRISTLPQQPPPSSRKYVNYLRTLPKARESSLEDKLNQLYGSPDKPNVDKAVDLVQKIQQRQRLKLKNTDERDYKQVSNRIQLLTYIYNHQ